VNSRQLANKQLPFRSLLLVRIKLQMALPLSPKWTSCDRGTSKVPRMIQIRWTLNCISFSFSCIYGVINVILTQIVSVISTSLDLIARRLKRSSWQRYSKLKGRRCNHEIHMSLKILLSSCQAQNSWREYQEHWSTTSAVGSVVIPGGKTSRFGFVCGYFPLHFTPHHWNRKQHS
jgi:hypothetical protein